MSRVLQGFLSGGLWGAILSVVGLGALSLVAPQPPGSTPPAAPMAQAPERAGPEADAGSADVAVLAATGDAGGPAAVAPTVGTASLPPDGPAPDTATALRPDPVPLPEAPAAPEVGAAPGPAPQADAPVLPNPQAPAPDQPQAEADLTLSTAPAPPPQDTIIVVTDAPLDPVAPDTGPEAALAPAPDTDGVAPEAVVASPEPAPPEPVTVPDAQIALAPQPVAPAPGEAAPVLPDPDAQPPAIAAPAPPSADSADQQPAPDTAPAAPLAGAPPAVPATAPSDTPPDPPATTAPAPALDPPADAPTPVADSAPATEPAGPVVRTLGGGASALPAGDGTIRVLRPDSAAESAEVAEPAVAAPPATAAPALAANAAAFANPTGLPPLAIILIDGGAMADAAAAVVDLGLPVTIAVDPASPDAAARAAAYRAAGLEVLAILRLPDGATATDTAVTLEAALATLPQTVGLLDPDGRADDSVLTRLAQGGHGLVAPGGGLGGVLRDAADAGVPARLIADDLDADGQAADVIRRFLDNAARMAGQDPDDAVIVARVRPETLAALADWAANSSRAGQVALAPVSAVLPAP